MPETTLWRIERRKLRAAPDRQAALARELGASVDELFAPVERSPRDAAIIEDYARLGSSIRVARKRKVSKEVVLGALHRAGVVTRDRTCERAERLGRVAELDAAGVPRKEMAEELGVSRSQIQADLRDLNRPKRPPRRKHPAPEKRVCALEGCDEKFTPTGYSVAQGWGRFCSRPCARAAERVAEPEPRTCRYQHCDTVFTPWPSEGARPGRGQFCSHRCRQLHFWRDEREKVQPFLRSVAERYATPKGRAHLLKASAQGLFNRHGHTGAFGRVATLIAAERGKRVGRRSEADAFAELIRDLNRQGWTQQAIADGTGLSRDVVGRFLRA
jgi:DNA invertase Pin-like site-specific DNA recombinase